MNKFWKIVIPIIFALAALLGFVRRSHDDTLKKSGYTAPAQLSADSLQSYYQKSQDAVAVASTSTTVTFLAGGDIMLSRNVASTIKKAGDPLLPFKALAPILDSTDFNFANLESPVAELVKNQIVGGNSLIFGAPQENIQGLKTYNFRMVNLANNHAYDQGLKGLLFTKNYLGAQGIKNIGTGNTLEEAWQPQIITVHGVKIAFIGASFSSLNDGGNLVNNNVARIEDVSHLKAAIVAAKTMADYVVVTMHAGVEYTRNPTIAQTTFARAAIDAGTDIVIGAHPHWIQTIEHYKGKYIFYSLGNFIFDQEWSQDTKEGLALKIQITKNQVPNTTTLGAATMDDLQGTRQPAQLSSIELMPIILENYSTPRLATTEESKKILQKIKQNETSLK